jgi:hypothetical protein
MRSSADLPGYQARAALTPTKTNGNSEIGARSPVAIARAIGPRL